MGIHHSSEYSNVLVQANILDAVANSDYLTSIILRYARNRRKILVFSDVNATILMEDTIEGKATDGVLLSTMFALTELCPFARSDFERDCMPAITVEKQANLKQLVRGLTKKDNAYYHKFWNNASCGDFLRKALSVGNTIWAPSGETLTEETF